MKKFLLSLLALSILSIAVIANAKSIRIGTEGAYPPWNNINTAGELEGAEIDFGNEACKRMGVDCEWVTQDWDGIIPALLARKYDAIIASMSITEDRLKVVDFSNKYYSNVLAFVGPAGKTMDTSKAGLKGLVLGAQRSTIAGQTLEDNYGDVVDVKLYDTQDNAYLDLAAGRIDGILSDKFPAYDWLQTEDGAKFEFKGEDLDIDDEIGIAIRKGDKLKEKLNKALDAIVANGTYKEINAKYFPFDIY